MKHGGGARTSERGTSAPPITGRLGGAPISWGVCEVPGWGVMMPVDRVLNEMRSLGIAATELGAPGFLPRDVAELGAVLDRHEMSLIGGFVPLVLHDPAQRDATIASASATARFFAALGATTFVTAVVVDEGWARRLPLDDAAWRHVVAMLAEVDRICGDHGLRQALHPHVGTLVETADDVRIVLDRSDVGWCLDTGHLAIGGYPPERFAVDAADRVVHVHLKDVAADVAERVGAGQLTIQQGVNAGLFRPLGAGDADIAATVAELERIGYEGWYVLEQDTDLGATVPPPGEGPLADSRAGVEYLRRLENNRQPPPQQGES